MARIMLSRLACCTTLVLLAVALAAVEQPIFGADGKSTVKKVLKKKVRGRLPAYYAKVVTDEQREKIYKIQAEYRPKIKAIKAQLKALKKERKDKIAAVLTPQQKKQVEEAAAKAKRKSGRPKPVEPAKKAPATPAK